MTKEETAKVLAAVPPDHQNLKRSMEEHMRRVKLLHESDIARGYGDVYLPHALERKYPKASREFVWQYLFPAKVVSKDPVTGKIRRHHMHENSIQKAVKDAARLAGITKRITVHTFRHCFANAPFGGRLRYPDGSGTPWTQRCLDHDDLYSRPKPAGDQREESVGRMMEEMDIPELFLQYPI
jgi:integrase